MLLLERNKPRRRETKALSDRIYDLSLRTRVTPITTKQNDVKKRRDLKKTTVAGRRILVQYEDEIWNNLLCARMVQQAGGVHWGDRGGGTVVTKDDMGLKNSHGIQNTADIVSVYAEISLLLTA
jgi:hypothetical protein